MFLIEVIVFLKAEYPLCNRSFFPPKYLFTSYLLKSKDKLKTWMSSLTELDSGCGLSPLTLRFVIFGKEWTAKTIHTKHSSCPTAGVSGSTLRTPSKVVPSLPVLEVLSAHLIAVPNFSLLNNTHSSTAVQLGTVWGEKKNLLYFALTAENWGPASVAMKSYSHPASLCCSIYFTYLYDITSSFP